MLLSQNLPNIHHVHISAIETGAILVNLGTLLEIEEYPQHYCLIIARMNEKQVIKFEKDILLATEK